MQIVIDIPDKEVPNSQEIIDISLHFIDGEVCECNYPYIVLPKGHGDLIDRNVAREAMMFEMSGTGYQGRAMHILDSEIYTPTVIETDGGDAE